MPETNTFNDLIKRDVLKFIQQGDIHPLHVLLTLGCTLLLSILIYFVYKRSYKGVLYNKAFNISLVLTSLITSLVIMTITSNFVLSLGMVGALSIVRFRTAVKEALDIVFMFWSISIGITCGAGFFVLAIIASVVITFVLLILDAQFKSPWHKDPYLLVMSYVNPEVENYIFQVITEEAGKYRIRSKTISDSHTELTIELRLSQESHRLVDKMSQIKGVSNVLLVSYSGDATG
ncbi:MAG: DUF4956 domain-containing protein [Spirochaetales bacterium]|nr:DUF4956 domain-containing protein [Spirochaetales bacterium]